VAIRVDFTGKKPEEGSGELQPLVGIPEELAEAFRGFAREVISHLQLLLNPGTVASLEALTPALALVDGS
jgi:hypothetical protein